MNKNCETVAAIIVAAGRGQRAGEGALPKQYRLLSGVPVLTRTLRAFEAAQRVSTVTVVIHPDDRDLYEQATQGVSKLSDPVMGGDTRQQSVMNGMAELACQAPDIVLVHDAARPFVSVDLINSVIDHAEGDVGALPVLPLAETLKRGRDGFILETVSRDGLFGAQTPQGFPFAALFDAHRKARLETDEKTDDAAVFEEAGNRIRMVTGERINVKLTTQDDFDFAETVILPQMTSTQTETRIGQGFDVHAFGPGDHVVLGGVKIPNDKSLVGHSDADVVLHALTDSLLGALGQGDIGTHYPPSDPAWKDADSTLFLKDSADRVTAAGGRIVHVDLTIICQAPKIGPHRQAIVEAISKVCDVPGGRISVKATTTERLGFTGRKEGIAAMAVSTIELPRQ